MPVAVTGHRPEPGSMYWEECSSLTCTHCAKHGSLNATTAFGFSCAVSLLLPMVGPVKISLLLALVQALWVVQQQWELRKSMAHEWLRWESIL